MIFLIVLSLSFIMEQTCEKSKVNLIGDGSVCPALPKVLQLSSASSMMWWPELVPQITCFSPPELTVKLASTHRVLDTTSSVVTGPAITNFGEASVDSSRQQSGLNPSTTFSGLKK